MRGRLVASLVSILLLAGGSAAYLLTGASPRLGLDLQGGLSTILTPIVEAGGSVDTDVLDRTIDVIRARVDALGVAEPEVSRQGDVILVQLPGVQDPDRAQGIIGRTAKLTFRAVLQVLSPGSGAYGDPAACLGGDRPELTDDGGIACGSDEEAQLMVDPESGDSQLVPLKYLVGAVALEGTEVDDALPIPLQLGPGGSWRVDMTLSNDGGDLFADVTRDLACIRDGQLDLVSEDLRTRLDALGPGADRSGSLAIVLDDVVESAPVMNTSVLCAAAPSGGITGGVASITVSGTDQEQESRDLALILKTGALEISLEVQDFDPVSATLGEASLRTGLLAGALGFGLVIIYLIGFYRWLGLIAVGGLVVFALLIVGLITALGEVGFTLTLAGIAGVIVSIGITADSSIIYFERIKDEVETGRTMRTSVQRAFVSAFRTNLTGNTVTFAAALILYFLAVGQVRGFALTLGASTLLDLLILYFYTRSAVGLLGRTKRLSAESIRVQRPEEAG